jgi:hypothetical protein
LPSWLNSRYWNYLPNSVSIALLEPNMKFHALMDISRVQPASLLVTHVEPDSSAFKLLVLSLDTQEQLIRKQSQPAQQIIQIA